MLWSEFFALGTYEPLFRLVQGLSLVENKGSMEEYQENPTEALGYEAMLEAMHQAIQWSLASNYRQHDLIRSYLRFMYEYEDLSETVKISLGLSSKRVRICDS
jgi:spore cortex formation protein SpoVR/YcgB (stage V sporulation)